jgi:RimJ/RimL family protein N-acetyltransferase
MSVATLQLVTERLILRPWRDSDRAPFVTMNADPLVMTYFASTMTPEESEETIARFQAAYELDGFGFLTAELRSTGAFAGIIGAQTMRDEVPNLPQPAVEIGWRLPRAFHGQGLATEGARATVDFCFSTLNLKEVVAVTALGNDASRRVMEKLGMTYRPDLEFDHPRMPAGHPHQRHALYQLKNPTAPQRTTYN